MRVVVGTVVYPQAMKWAKVFFDSLSSQTDNQFEVLIVNDGVDIVELQKIKDEIVIQNTIIVSGKPGASISQNRILMLEEAKKRNYDIIVCCDFDDVFSANRIELIKAKYDCRVTVYYNNLRLFNSSEDIFKNIPLKVVSYKTIEEKNYLGLSNTAINLNQISMSFIDSLEEVETNIFDWYLFSRIFINANKGKYISNTYTYYRQQENNLAGISQSSENAQKREIQVKLNQYKLLKKYEPSYSKLYNEYLQLLNVDIKEWKKYLSHDNNGFWWSNFQLRREK